MNNLQKLNEELNQLKSLISILKKAATVSISENEDILPSDFIQSMDIILNKIENIQKLYEDLTKNITTL